MSLIKVGRDLHYAGDIDDAFLTSLSAALLVPARRRPTRLVLSTSGGDDYTYLGVVDVLERVGGLEVLAVGRCLSAGVPVVAACKKGKRIASSWCRFMVHSGEAESLAGTYPAALAAEAREMHQLEDLYAGVLARHCKPERSMQEWRKICDRHVPYYFDSSEALAMGIIDEVAP